MPYTSEELRDVDFYSEFLDKREKVYLERVTKSAYQGFKREDGTRVLFQALEDDQLGFEDANLETAGLYSTFVSALSNNAGNQLLNILNAEFNAFMSDTSNLQGFSANMNPQQIGAPTQYNQSDVPTYIRELAQGKPYYTQLPEYIKTTNLEKIIDRSISELSETRFAETLPDGIENGDVITNEFADDYRKWLIQNNQKRIFPDLATFYGNVTDWNTVKTLTMAQLRTIPNGEPVD
jgi:hypothetical protein